MAEPNPFEDTAKLTQAPMTDQFAGMANLLAHPVAGMAAASAIGFGMASHAFGLWAGAIAGATEVSRRMLAKPGQEKPAPPPRLKLVSSNTAPAVGGAARAAEGRVPARKTRPAKPDDLKAISGIGPKLEQVLNGLGIRSYGQIAGLTEAEIAQLDDQLGIAGRIQRDGWVEQAKSLASAPKSGSKDAGRKRS